MAHSKQQAEREFKRSLKWIAAIGAVTVVGALTYLKAMDAWSTHAVIATIFGVFVSMLLGCGLFALAFFSSKSGHDDDVASSTSKRDKP